MDGYRESEQSWYELLVDLKQRGLTLAPKLAIGDGALGFWAALRKVYGETREQRCWVHKTANVLNNMPKSVQPRAKADLHEIWMAETRGPQAKGLRQLPGKVRSEVRSSLRMSREGSRRAADFLRLPGRTLEAPADDESDRIDVRDDPPTTPTHQRQRYQANEPGHDVQARPGRPEDAGDDSTVTNTSCISWKERSSSTEFCRTPPEKSQNTTIDNTSAACRRTG